MGVKMKILLEQVVTLGDTETRITLIDSIIDNEQDAVRAYEAISAFDSMILSAGVFDNFKNNNENMHLELNGDDFGYADIDSWETLVEFVKTTDYSKGYLKGQRCGLVFKPGGSL